MNSRRAVTIICSHHRNSTSPNEWVLGFEGPATPLMIEATVKRLLDVWRRVKVFADRKCIGDFKSPQRKTLNPAGRPALRTNGMPITVRGASQPLNARA